MKQTNTHVFGSGGFAQVLTASLSVVFLDSVVLKYGKQRKWEEEHERIGIWWSKKCGGMIGETNAVTGKARRCERRDSKPQAAEGVESEKPSSPV
jgi:hypothetical protein